MDAFNFRIISCADGIEIIDTTLKTPYDSLTSLQMVEYMEIDSHMAIMERIERKQRRQQETARSPLWKLACFCGIL